MSENVYKAKFYSKGSIYKKVEEKLPQKYRQMFNFSFSRQYHSDTHKRDNHKMAPFIRC